MTLKISTLSSKDGLPNEQVHAISEDDKGRLWFAGPAGAMCYNGREIRSFDTRDGIDCPGLRTIQVEKQEVWLGTDRGIERLTTEGAIHPIALNFEWTYGIAECFLFMNDLIFIGTSGGLLTCEFQHQKLELKRHDNCGLVTQLIDYNNTVLLVCSQLGLVKIEGDAFNQFLEEEHEFTTQKLHLTIEKKLLIGTDQGLISVSDDGEIESHYIRKNGSSAVNAIQSMGSLVYVGFGKTLQKLQREVDAFNLIESTELQSRIKDIHLDSFDNLWVATNNSGLSKISMLNAVIHPLSGSKRDAAFCITQSNENELIIGGDGFYNHLKRNDVGSQVFHQFDFNSIVWDICIDPIDNHMLWIATEEGVFIKKGIDQPVLAENINKIVRGPNRCLQVKGDKVYVGTISGLYIITSENECSEILNNEGLSFGYVYTMSIDENHDIWVGTLGQGLWKEESQVFIPIIDNSITAKGNTYAIDTNPLGQTIVIQQENIILLNTQLQSEIILKEYPLGGWTACWIDNKTIAVGSSDGICIIDVPNKKILKRINLFLDRTEWQFTSSRSLKYSLENNTLYAGLNSGAFVIELDKLDIYCTQAEVHLNNLEFKNVNPTYNDSVIQLESGRWTGQVSVFSTWYVDESTVQYRFKIEGFNDEWSELSPLNILHFNSLPPGEYSILAQAYTPLSLYGETKVIGRLKVNPAKTKSIDKFIGILNNFRGNADEQKNKTELLIRENELYQEELEERKKVEKELKNYRAQLEDVVNKRTQELYQEKERAVSADKLKTTFLATMSHEIRTPLGGIIGLNNLLKETGLTEIQEEYIQKIDFSSQHLLQIINDILDITKIESGSLQLEQVEFSLHQLIEEIGELINLKIGTKIHFLLDKKADLQHLVIGDPMRIKQVIINLVGNAIKFTEKGHIYFKIHQLNETDQEASVHFSVIDTGIGMTDEQQKGLFSAFKQGDDSITRKYGGTGLGLNISEKFIHLMNSEINVNSEENKGSEFSFTLVLKKSDKKDSTALQDNFNFNRNTQRIGLIDHYSPSRELIANYLNNFQFEVSFHEELNKEVLAANDFVILNTEANKNYREVTNIFRNEEVQAYKKKILVVSNVNDSDASQLKSITDYHMSSPVSPRKLVSNLTDMIQNITKAVRVSTADTTEEKNPQFTNEKHILVAEDNQINQLIIQKMLRRHGFTVTIAHNGAECVEALKQPNNFELVFMDIQMPEMDGIQATHLIRNELKNDSLPIVALTADVTVETKSKVKDYGMNDYLSKPINPADLITTLNSWIKL